MRLVGNTLFTEASENLVVKCKQSYDHQEVIALVVHSLVSILCGPKDHLRKPLHTLLAAPREMRVSELFSCRISVLTFCIALNFCPIVKLN